MEKKDYKNYFLGLMSAEDAEALELQIISNDEEEAELLQTEENLIEDYLDKNLTNEELQAFSGNFLVTKERRERVEFIKLIRDFAQNPATPAADIKEIEPGIFENIKSFLNPRKFAVGFGGFALILTIGFISYLGWKNLSNDSDKLEISVLLNKSFKNARPTEARITDFEYAPKIEGTRGNNDKTQDLNFVSAKSRAVEAVLKNETAENLHALGRVYLAEQNFDEAVKQFEKALKKNPNIAQLHNDLGVALMEKAKQKEEGKLELFAKANEEFVNAIELDKNLLEAYFNEALSLQALNLPNQAKEAWQNYLNLDSKSKWADEAHKNLEAIEIQKPISKSKEEILRDFLTVKGANDDERAWNILSKNREITTGKLIPQQLAFLFVDAKSNGDETAAKEALDALVYAGKVEEERSGDLFWRDLGEFYKNVPENEISNLKAAQNAFKKALQLRKERGLEKSTEEFKKAGIGFIKTGNILESRICDYWIANQMFHLNQVKKSNEMYLEAAEFSSANQYKWLASQAYIRLAYGVGVGSEISKSLDYSRKALKLAEATNDIYDLQRIYSLLADKYRQLGRFEPAFYYSEKNLDIDIVPEASQRQKWNDYVVATNLLFAKDFYKTSLAYQKEALILAQDIKEKYFEQVSLFHLGMIYTSDAQYDIAEKCLIESIQIAETFEDEQVRKKNVALAKLKYAHLKRILGQYDDAIALYEESNKFHSISEFQLEKYDGQRGKLMCYLKMNDDFFIQQQIPIVLNIFKDYRKEILEEQNRNSFFDQEQNIYDLVIEYEYGKANYERAFNYTEESRSRSLLDLMSSGAKVFDSHSKADVSYLPAVAEPSNLTEVQARMPEQVQIVEYTMLQDRIVIWLITKEGFKTTQAEVKSDDLQKLVTSYLNLIKQPDVSNAEKEKELALELYEKLITPIAEMIDPQKDICFVPDKFLFYLPFAALISPKSQNYLIADNNIFYAPSASAFLISSKKAREREGDSNETLLSIGNPSFDEKSYPNLSKLESSEKESEEISEFYRNSTQLNGQDSTKENVKRYLFQSDVVHFAGHYIINEQSPYLSGFVLAQSYNSEEENDSLLTNYEIIGEKFSHTKLIILSACQTGIDGYYKGEGIIGASRTFLAKGVPLVVASQWSVDSEATKELMVSFHRFRTTQNLTSVASLRKAQLEMISSSNQRFRHPYLWAGFTALGGYSAF
ncbi:hypothetical protein BH20ACI1_BH20ACI1_07670 [soil metagenome]